MNFLLWGAQLNNEAAAPSYLLLGAFATRADAEAAAESLAGSARWVVVNDLRRGTFTPPAASRYLSPEYFAEDFFAANEPAAGPGR